MEAQYVKPNRTWLRWIGLALLALVLWSLVVVGFSAQLVGATTMTWSQALRFTSRDWIPWVLLSPLIFGLVLAVPFERRTLRLTVPAYLLAGILSITLAGLTSEWLASTAWFDVGAVELEGQRPNLPDRGPPRFREGPPPEGREPGGPRGSRMGPPPFARGRRGLLPPVWLRARFNFPVFVMVLSIANAWVLYRLSQERGRRTLELSTHLAQAKLQALRLQLQPHFLFNALNAISTLVHKDLQRADDMIANLSDLLRAALETQEQEVPVRRELQLLDLYLDIERMRLGSRLSIENHIQPDTLDLLVPTMILQPIAENAIRHGIEPRLAPGLLVLESLRLKDRLVLTVRDNGIGIPSQSQSQPPRREGIGLANTRARLQELYGSRAAITVQSSPETGTAVHIEIPLPPNPPVA